MKVMNQEGLLKGIAQSANHLILFFLGRFLFIFETEAAFLPWLLGPQSPFVFALRPKPPISYMTQ